MKQAIENLSVSVMSSNRLNKEVTMSIIEKAIEVNVPVHTAYNQWTQFEKLSSVHGRCGAGSAEG